MKKLICKLFGHKWKEYKPEMKNGRMYCDEHNAICVPIKFCKRCKTKIYETLSDRIPHVNCRHVLKPYCTDEVTDEKL